MALLRVENVAKDYEQRAGLFGRNRTRAVVDVTFSLPAGKTLAIVGESGSGKSTTARLAMRLLAPSRGRVVFEGEDITLATGERLRRVHRRMQMVFQDPAGALNPRMTVGATLREMLALAGSSRATERRGVVLDLVEQVGLSATHLDLRPGQLSGGQRQRVGIARALASRPVLIACDEPVSALDVSVQAQIVNLLRDLQRDRGISYLFISHDLHVVRHMADQVLVLYRGHVVESAPKAAIFKEPRHPYTRLLFAAAGRHGRREIGSIARMVAGASAALTGCVFAPLCPDAASVCAAAPTMRAVAEGHDVACHRVHEERG